MHTRSCWWIRKTRARARERGAHTQGCLGAVSLGPASSATASHPPGTVPSTLAPRARYQIPPVLPDMLLLLPCLSSSFSMSSPCREIVSNLLDSAIFPFLFFFFRFFSFFMGPAARLATGRDYGSVNEKMVRIFGNTRIETTGEMRGPRGNRTFSLIFALRFYFTGDPHTFYLSTIRRPVLFFKRLPTGIPGLLTSPFVGLIPGREIFPN